MMQFPDFPGGTIAIDIDADGNGPAHWQLRRRWGYQVVCEIDFQLEAPAQSWVCNGMPADNYTLHAFSWHPPSGVTWFELGARW